MRLHVFINIPIVNEYSTPISRYYETFTENTFNIVKISTLLVGFSHYAFLNACTFLN